MSNLASNTGNQLVHSANRQTHIGYNNGNYIHLIGMPDTTSNILMIICSTCWPGFNSYFPWFHR